MAQDVIIEEQHPIPQQISSFQFRLVGDMTIKQFMQIAAGAVIALIFYASGLPAFIKWPLIFLSFGFGAALAFLPLEDRPLGKWIISFFKSIYSPTLFIWKHTQVAPLYFQAEGAAVAPEAEPAASAAAAAQLPAEEIEKTPHEKKLEEKEQSFLSRITHAMRIPHTTPTPTEPATAIATGVAPILPTEQPKPKPKPKPSEAIPIEVSLAREKAKVQPQVKPLPEKAKEEVAIPKTGVITVEKEEADVEVEKKEPEVLPSEPAETSEVAPILIKGDKLVGKQAQFSQEAAPPIPPTQPNVIVGQVVDPNGKIVEGAILEIKDEEGRPVRALKSNKLGHFMIVTPLLSGKYTMTTEKNGLIFDPISFEAVDEILPPIAIWAKEKVATHEQPSVDESQIYNI